MCLARSTAIRKDGVRRGNLLAQSKCRCKPGKRKGQSNPLARGEIAHLHLQQVQANGVEALSKGFLAMTPFSVTFTSLWRKYT